MKNTEYCVKRIVFPSSGERYVILEGPPHGIAMEAPSIYTSLRLREMGLSPNSMAQHLGAIALLLKWAADRSPAIDIDQRLQSVQLLSGDEVIDLRRALRQNLNVHKIKDTAKKAAARTTVRHGHYYFRCHAVRDYISWHAQRSIDRILARDVERLVEARTRLDEFRFRMTGDLPSPRQRSREGVGEEVQAIFLEAIRPGSSTNPFQRQHQIRNYALLLLYHEHGVRKADALKIKGEDMHLFGARPTLFIVVRHDEQDDPRRREPRHKTFGRPLPLGERLADALTDWMLNERPKYPNAKKSPYAFLARSGAPLSLAAVDDMFCLLRERVPGLPPDFTAHITRHNANDRFSAEAKRLGWSEGEEKLNRNHHFGWSKTSTQGDRYRTRSIREGAADASLRMQRASVDKELE